MWTLLDTLSGSRFGLSPPLPWSMVPSSRRMVRAEPEEARKWRSRRTVGVAHSREEFGGGQPHAGRRSCGVRWSAHAGLRAHTCVCARAHACVQVCVRTHTLVCARALAHTHSRGWCSVCVCVCACARRHALDVGAAGRRPRACAAVRGSKPRCRRLM